MNHKKVYMKCLNIGPEDIVLCEVCGAVAVDIHHIEFRSQGGTNYIQNLIALCRNDHDIAHGKVKGQSLSKEWLLEVTKLRSD